MASSSLEAELERAEALETAALADAIESIGFDCTRCGACCKGYDSCGGSDGGNDTAERGADETSREREPHTATVFPDEIRRLLDATAERGMATGAEAGDGGADVAVDDAADYDWRDVARPMPYGLTEGEDGPTGETFEWALQTDACGDCTFYREDDGEGACAVHEDRPLVCRTYPFSVALGGTSQPMGEAVDSEGLVRAHECEGLGREISREDAEELASALKERAVRELEEAIGVRDNYEPTDVDGVVVHDSEGQKRPDGTPLETE